MNERIRELAIEAGIITEVWKTDAEGHGYKVPNYEAEKFAELIVTECIDVFSKDLPEDSGKMLEVVNRVCNVAEHFGVKE